MVQTVDRITARTATEPTQIAVGLSAAMMLGFEVLVIVDLAALILIGAAILFAWAGWQWLIGW